MAIAAYIADDHAVVVDGLRALLEAEPDIEVVGHANNGRIAVQEITLLRPDVVIMDIAMPDLNGIEATRLLHDRDPAIKVIILSMHSNAEHVLRAVQAGARAYLLKASAGHDVIAALRAVHSGKRYFCRKIAELVLDSQIVAERGAGSLLAGLSSRERQVMQLLVEGKTVAVIAKVLALSPRTVETYRSRLMHKLGIDNLPDLVKYAIQQGITPLD
jgi:DNA-binding NarL/FixJ family response regulator